jgi:hypothetical protein
VGLSGLRQAAAVLATINHVAQRLQESVAIDVMFSAGIVHGVEQAIGQPTHPILKSRKTRIAAGCSFITSATRSSNPIGMCTSSLN